MKHTPQAIRSEGCACGRIHLGPPSLLNEAVAPVSQGDKTFLAVACTVVGVGLGFAVPHLAGWAADLPWIPFHGPLELLGSFDSPIATWIRPVVGLLLGLAFTAYLVHQSPVLHVSPEQIEVTSRDAFVAHGYPWETTE